MAAMYAVHHGPDGLAAIAHRILRLRAALATGLEALQLAPDPGVGFDTVRVVTPQAPALLARAAAAGFNLRPGDGAVAISLDELSTPAELEALLHALAGEGAAAAAEAAVTACRAQLQQDADLLSGLPRRQGPWLQQEVFHRYRSETELLRYLQRLVSKDLSLVHGMIPLGSCTMKLNAAAELAPVSWPGFAQLHPFAPPDQLGGYRQLTQQLEGWLA